MRQPAYDPNGTFRSATTQTSRMYTSIAPAVQETIQHVQDSEHLRARHAAEELRRSQEIAEMRTRLLNGVKPRGDIRFGG
jgi:aspartate/tyrosine/aromatic aminotransferase